MKIKKIFLASMLAASLSANAQELTGDTRLACEAILCLMSPTRPGECAASIARYFSISFRRFNATLNARRSFLALCPRVDESAINQVIQNYPPEPDQPDPPPDTPPPDTPPPAPLTRAELERAILVLTAVWQSQLVLSGHALEVLEQCVQRNGRVQDGNCSAEKADYDARRLPAIASREEIYRLQGLLRALPE